MAEIQGTVASYRGTVQGGYLNSPVAPSSGGGVILPAGQNGSVLVHNGTEWVAERSNPYYGANTANFVSSGSVTFGTNSRTLGGSNSIAIGSQAYGTGLRAISMGDRSTATAENALAIGGLFTNATGFASVAFGAGTNATGSSSIAIIGDSLIAHGISIGSGSVVTAQGPQGLAIGRQSTCNGQDGIAFGHNSDCQSGFGIALGSGAVADAWVLNTSSPVAITSSADAVVAGSYADQPDAAARLRVRVNGTNYVVSLYPDQ